MAQTEGNNSREGLQSSLSTYVKILRNTAGRSGGTRCWAGSRITLLIFQHLHFMTILHFRECLDGGF